MSRDRNDPGACARCGACVPVCPVFQADGRESSTARGKMRLLALGLDETPTAACQEIFARCLLCGRCEEVCARHLELTAILRRSRERFPPFSGPRFLPRFLARQTLASPSLLRGLVRAGIGLRRLALLPADSGLRLRLALLDVPRPASSSGLVRAGAGGKEGDVQWFGGCLARILQPRVGEAVLRLLDAGGLTTVVPAEQGCCGLAATSAGKPRQARRLAWRNIRAFAGRRGPILTSCSSCFSHLRAYPDLFAPDDPRHREARDFAARVREFSSFFLAQALAWRTDAGEERVLFHDPCHLRRLTGGREHPRALLARVPGLILVEAADGSACCGQGGLFHLACPDLSGTIFARCADSALAAAPDLVTTTCTGCLLQWRLGAAEHGLPVRVVHLASLLAERLE